jgi:hypothetical protein
MKWLKVRKTRVYKGSAGLGSTWHAILEDAGRRNLPSAIAKWRAHAHTLANATKMRAHLRGSSGKPIYNV